VIAKEIEVLTIGAPILKEKAAIVEEFSTNELRDLIQLLFEKQDKTAGIGIAAPQIGISQRLFVYGIERPNPRYPDVALIPNTVIINPEIIWTSEETSERCEGCLSVPGVRIPIIRPDRVKVVFQNVDGVKIEMFRNIVCV